MKRRAGALISTIFSGPSRAAFSISDGVQTLSKETTELLADNESEILLKIFTAEVDVQLMKSMSAELLRATKKNAPAKFKYHLLYVCYSFYLSLFTGLIGVTRPEKMITIVVRRKMRHSQKISEARSRI